MADAQNDFAARLQRGNGKQIQCAPDRAFGRVFHGRDQIIRLTGFNLFEAVVYGRTRHCMRGMTEMLNRRLLGKRALRYQIDNGQRTFDGEALAHHFPKQACYRFVGQRPLFKS